jgi:transposase InsO family protein
MTQDHSIATLCAVLDVPRSGYHSWLIASPSERQQIDAALVVKIQSIHAQHKGRYGAPRIEHELRTSGHYHSRKRVARLMKEQGLRGRCSRRFVPQTTDSDHDEPIAPNRLAAEAAPQKPNQVWVSDLTYVATQEGWLYVAVILDLWSRRVIGWSTGPTLQSCLVLSALQMALRHRQPKAGLIHHSDRGVQYASAEHRAALKAASIEASMSRTANPYDNATMESFMATYKRECVELSGGYATRAEGTTDFFEYVESYYNRERIHSALGYKTPVDFENQLN